MYLESAIPSAEQNRRTVKTSWAGLNRRDDYDSGELTSCKNISVKDIPALEAEQIPKDVITGYAHPISIHGFGDVLIVIYRDGGAIKLDYRKGSAVYHSTIKATGATEADEYPRSLARFNLYSSGDSGVAGSVYVRKILIYPDRYSFDYEQSADFTVSYLTNDAPALQWITVYQGRLWGVKDGKIYASAFNDYASWLPATADEDSASMPWNSATQANIKADGEFTGIVTYDNHVLGFKRDFIHQTANTKYPFRLNDISAKGAISNLAICECSQILFYVSDDGIYAFTGGYPERISDKLKISSFEGSILGTWDNVLYAYVPAENFIFTYCPATGCFGGIECNEKIIGMTYNDDSLYALTDTGKIKSIPSGEYGAFEFTTDLTLGGELQEKRLKKARVRCVIPTGGNVKLKYGDRILSDSGAKVGVVVLSTLIRQTCDFGHKLTVSGTGHCRIEYLQTEIAYGGERDCLR